MVLIRDFIVGIVGLVIGLIFTYLSSGMPIMIAKGYPGPSFFPIILALASIIVGVFLMVRYFKKNKNIHQPISSLNKVFLSRGLLRNQHVKNSILFLVAIATYIQLIPYLGFLLTSFTFLYVTQLIYGVPSVRALGVSVVVLVFLYMLFIVTLKVVIPEPILGSLLLR